jgi:hypothetical protein
MLDISYICPLKLPRTHILIPSRQRRSDHGFPADISIDKAIEFLEDEIKALEPTRAVIYSNYDRLNSERNRVKREEDSAVCCELRIDNRTYYLICDRWTNIEHNLYALHLTLRNIRNMTKWGVGTIKNFLAGFDAAGSQHQELRTSDDGVITPEWMNILGLGISATIEDANMIYRHRAKEAATDPDRLLSLNQAIESARKYFGVR